MAKESLRDNASPKLRYEEFPDGVDIASVSTSSEFAEIWENSENSLTIDVFFRF